ncbi:DUF6602 domain-containing protein [Methylobacterium marchantiae]|uniref:DUF6602 domain-containing protein n=1 Tax=Methylobacterium marchantiae TaxID=600331 RepID=A0ABW3X3M2_9HYPH|nr:hypothetical protein AIGOOFII_4027 [Methylobacterium marchantiae]
MRDVSNDATKEAAKGHQVRSFFKIEAQTLRERYRVIETLLPNANTRGAAHRGEEGRFIESLLRAFLNKHLPSNLQAVSGFILCPSTKTGVSNTERVLNEIDRHSTQVDIIIYDFDAYPTYERYEEFCIVPPEGVVGLISVKKTLRMRDLKEELAALRNIAALCAERDRRGPCTAIFGFSTNEKSQATLNKKIFSEIESAYEGGCDFDSMINEISVMGNSCVFKVRSTDSSENKARYVGVDCKLENHIPLQRLIQTILSVYYDRSRGSTRDRPGFVSFEKSTFKNSPDLGEIRYDSLQRYNSSSK